MITISLKDLLYRYNYEIFDFEYDLNRKEEFEKRFVDEYMYRNIGFETIQMFKHYLRVAVQDISPYYNTMLATLSDIEIQLERGSKISESHTLDSDETLEDKQISNESHTLDTVETSEDTQESNGTGQSMTQELGSVNEQGVIFNNINNAVKNITDGLNSSSKERNNKDSGTRDVTNNTNKESNKKDRGTREVINHDIPLHEAIQNVKLVRIDVIKDMINELNDLFSLIIW